MQEPPTPKATASDHNVRNIVPYKYYEASGNVPE
jgi:hypothetical protein